MRQFGRKNNRKIRKNNFEKKMKIKKIKKTKIHQKKNLFASMYQGRIKKFSVF